MFRMDEQIPWDENKVYTLDNLEVSELMTSTEPDNFEISSHLDSSDQLPTLPNSSCSHYAVTGQK